MRLRPLDSTFAALENGDLQICFDLPKGTYATTLLSELAELDESSVDAYASSIQRNEG
jgi:tRNA(Glu) U13 pseudouridine synthase TruD